jgi:type II secretory pathway component PulF
MSVFRYSAAQPEHRAPKAGVISAPSEVEARRMLRATGLRPIRIREINGSRVAFGPFSALITSHLRRRRTGAKAEFYDALATLLRSGVTPRDALLVLADSHTKSSGIGSLARLLAEDIAQGVSLSHTARHHRAWFDDAECAVIGAGERSGELEVALIRLSERQARSSDLGSRLTSVLAYPMLVSIAGLGVAIFLANHTLPQLTQVLQDADVDIPRLTQVVMVCGQYAFSFAPPIAIAALIMLVSGVAMIGSSRFQVFPLPIACSPRVFRRIATAETFLMLAELTESGLTLNESIKVTAPTATGFIGRSLTEEWQRVAQRIEQGGSFDEALSNRIWFTPEHQRLVASGMRAGELATTLRRVGERDRRSAHRLIDRLATMIEPFAIVLLTFFIGAIVLAAVLPIVRLQEIIG